MLLVSIHDVSPATAMPVGHLWNMCQEHGIIPALLVVPNWHGSWPLGSYPDFVRWVRARRDQGAVILLHGERHDEVGLGRNLHDHWRAWGRTAREGEFLTLDRAASDVRLRRGIEQLREVGLDPLGFVPPAWLARESTHRAAGAAGLRVTEDDRSVRLHPAEIRIPSPVVRWSARSAARAWGSAAVAAARSRIQVRTSFPRIALHPNDLDHPATRASVLRTLKRWLGRHSPGRYTDLLARFAA
jgi:uncharacterized protein